MKTKSVLTAGLLTALLAACGGHTQVTNSQMGPAPSSGESKTLHYESADGKVKIDKTPYSLEQLNQLRAQYRRTNLVQLPVDAKYNTDVFRITDESIADYRNKLFIAPRIYSYGTQDGGRLLPIQNPDGTTTLSFNVIFLDGTTRTIPRPEANGSVINVPDTFTIQHADELKALLHNSYGSDNGLSALPGCPKKIRITAGDYSADVTPEQFSTADYCKLNTPLSISLRVPKEVAKNILQKALPMNAVNVLGTFETRVSYPTSNVRIQFDRQRTLSDLRAELGVKAFFFDMDVKLAIKKVVQNQLMSVIVQGETSEYVNNLIEKVSSQFFEAFPADPSIPESAACGSAALCVRFSLARMDASSTMDFSFAADSNEMTGQNYLTATTLKPTPRMITIGDFNCDHDARRSNACNRVSSGKAAVNTGLTVYEGDQIKLDLNAIVQTTFASIPTAPNRVDNPVCTRYVCSGSRCESWAAGMCMEIVNQWTETTTIPAPAPQVSYLTGESANAGEIYDNLIVRFTHTDHDSMEKVEVDCPLSAFPRVGDGQSLTVKLKNVTHCVPFTHDPNEVPMISLLMKKLPDQVFEWGTRIRRWDRSVPTTYSSQIVTPEIDFEGTLTLQGLYIESNYELE